VIVGVIAAYVAFTFAVTERRIAIRRQMNDTDQDAHQKAVDSLLNFETVKYFNADPREAAATTRPWRAMRKPRSAPPPRSPSSMAGRPRSSPSASSR
jgi:ABC-type transport system involved in Fe-S cluster assembly fused permease/ATPase subunit